MMSKADSQMASPVRIAVWRISEESTLSEEEGPEEVTFKFHFRSRREARAFKRMMEYLDSTEATDHDYPLVLSVDEPRVRCWTGYGTDADFVKNPDVLAALEAI